MKQQAKQLLKTLLPERYYIGLMSWRARKTSEKLEREWGCVDVAKKLIDRQGAVVANGPFKGMRFPPFSHGRHISPKLLGSYERELWEVVARLSKNDYNQIVDVGSAEGYYAVGLALLFPDTPVVAFDADPWAREATRRMANLNSAKNVSVRFFCSLEWLSKRLPPNSLLISDCEGFEDSLLKPAEVEALRSCDIVVEVHEGKAPGVTRRIKNRFRDSHSITEVRGERRDPSIYESISFLEEEEQRIAVRKYRSGPPKWLYMESSRRK